MSDQICTFPGCNSPGVVAWGNREGATTYFCEPCQQAFTNMTRAVLEPGGQERMTRFLRDHGVLPGVRGIVDDA